MSYNGLGVLRYAHDISKHTMEIGKHTPGAVRFGANGEIISQPEKEWVSPADYKAMGEAGPEEPAWPEDCPNPRWNKEVPTLTGVTYSSVEEMASAMGVPMDAEPAPVSASDHTAPDTCAESGLSGQRPQKPAWVTHACLDCGLVHLPPMSKVNDFACNELEGRSAQNSRSDGQGEPACVREARRTIEELISANLGDDASVIFRLLERERALTAALEGCEKAFRTHRDHLDHNFKCVGQSYDSEIVAQAQLQARAALALHA